MNTNTEIQTARAESNLLFESSSKTSKKFKGKKLNNYLPSNVFFSKKSSTIRMDKQTDDDSINKSLQSMNLSAIPPKKAESLTYVAYIPTTHNSIVLIASVPRSKVFTIQEYEKSPIRDIKFDIAQKLLNIPENPIILEQQARKGAAIYDFKPPSYNNPQPIQPIVENTLPINIDLKTWGSSIIYVKKYFSNLSKEIYNLTYKCGGALCIESNVNLLTQHETYELKKNNDMKAILETISANKKYNFSIYANSVITGLTDNVYMNFFNIPEDDLKHILKNRDINSLELKQCNAN